MSKFFHGALLCSPRDGIQYHKHPPNDKHGYPENHRARNHLPLTARSGSGLLRPRFVDGRFNLFLELFDLIFQGHTFSSRTQNNLSRDHPIPDGAFWSLPLFHSTRFPPYPGVPSRASLDPAVPSLQAKIRQGQFFSLQLMLCGLELVAQKNIFLLCRRQGQRHLVDFLV